VDERAEGWRLRQASAGPWHPDRAAADEIEIIGHRLDELVGPKVLRTVRRASSPPPRNSFSTGCAPVPPLAARRS
jgi:hypothetical protein